MSTIKCDDCEYLFDAKDPRAWKVDSGAYCPLCAKIHFGSAYWTVKNDCNGPFEVFWQRKDAEQEIKKGDYMVAGCYIAPVVLVEIPQRSGPFYSAHSDATEREGTRADSSLHRI